MAPFSVTVSKAIEVSALHDALASISVESVQFNGTDTVTILRRAPLTPTEQAQVLAAIAAHDALAIQTTRQQHRQEVHDAIQQDPSALSIPQRLARLELIVGG